MLYKNTSFEQSGRSMVEMLGVLAIIGVLSVSGIAGYSRAMEKHKLSKTKDIIINTLTKYADLTSKNFGNLRIDGTNSQELAINANFIDECDLQPSSAFASSSYKVCKLPLGEHFIKVEPYFSSPHIYSYMYFISLIPANESACIDILSAGWQSMLPEDWWKAGRLWVKAPFGVLYTIYGSLLEANRGLNQIPKPLKYIKEVKTKNIVKACHDSCGKMRESCTIAFDFIGLTGIDEIY